MIPQSIPVATIIDDIADECRYNDYKIGSREDQKTDRNRYVSRVQEKETNIHPERCYRCPRYCCAAVKIHHTHGYCVRVPQLSV